MIKRPKPPEIIPMFLAAPEIYEWLNATILNPSHKWFNKDHEHLMDYDFDELSFLWAQGEYIKQGKQVLGQCEKVMMMAGGWKKDRQEMWFNDTLGAVPEYLITLDASYCRDCSDAEFMALIEHELYHIIHKTDKFGDPAFRDDGKPKLDLVSHDVEEFYGVVRRYGGDESVKTLSEIQSRAPLLSDID